MRTPRYLHSLLLVTVLVLATGPLLVAEDLQPPDRAEIDRIKSMKVEQRLYRVRDLAQSTALSSEDAWRLHGVRTIADSVQVRVLLKMEAKEQMRQLLEESGGRVQRWHGRSVRMIVPLNSLEWFENQDVVAAVYRPNYAEPEGVISEGLDTLGIPTYHDAGFRGQGVRIAIIDGEFRDYFSYLGSELPSTVGTKVYGSGLEVFGTHGTMCAQIIHDIAPEAAIWLIQVDDDLDVLAALSWVKTQNFDIVSMSLGFKQHGWPDGTSDMASEVNSVWENGQLFVKSAGNEAEDHYIGYFTDSDQDSYHEFAVGDESDQIFLTEGAELSIILLWNDWPYSDNDYDLLLYNDDLSSVVASSLNYQTGTQRPLESIITVAPYTGYYYIVIKNHIASGLHKFHMFIRGAYTKEHTSSYKSITIPADAEGALAVGAVPYSSPHIIESFSSHGPSEDARIKPDMVAPDNVSVRDGFGVVSFPGTSAACPHVAGAAAVFLSYRPLTTPSTIIDTFKTMCIDLGTWGPDNTYGWGLLHLRPPEINNAPYITLIPDKTVYEENRLYFYVYATDPDGDPLTYSASNLPPGASFNSYSRLFDWTPTQGQEGYYPNVVFTVSDGDLSDNEFVNITVLHTNRPPVILSIPDKTVQEGETLYFQVYAFDPDGDQIAVSVQNLPPGATFNSSTLSFSWTPDYDQSGFYSNVIFMASDGDLFDSDTINITVLEENRLPVLEDVTDKQIPENGLLTFAVHAVDPDVGDVVTYWSQNLPNGAIFSSTTGSFFWLPNFTQAGVYSNVIFGATDGEDSDADTITITVLDVNRSPGQFSLISPQDGDTVWANEAALVWLSSLDPDPDDEVEYTLKYSVSEQLPWQFSIEGILDTTRTIEDLQEGAEYFWQILATDDHDSMTICLSDFSFIAADITPPEFTISLMPSTVLPYQLDIYAFASEPLSSEVTGKVESSATSETQSMTKLDERYAETYFLDYALSNSGTYTISICGEDDFGNSGCSQKSISVALLHAGAGAELEEPSGSAGVSVPANACAKNGLLIGSIESALSEQHSGLDIPNGVTPHSIIHLKSSVGLLRSPAKLWFDTDVLRLLTNENNIPALFRVDGHVLEPVPVIRETHSSVFIAEISRFGRFLIATRHSDEAENEEPGVYPSAFALDQNQPNPFNSETLISYYLSRPCNVKLSIFNVLGQEVAVLVDGALPSGSHTTVWNGKDKRGNDCVSGLYLYRFRAESFTDTRRMVLLK